MTLAKVPAWIIAEHARWGNGLIGTLSFVYFKGKVRRWHPHEDRLPPKEPPHAGGPVEDTPICDACQQPITEILGGRAFCGCGRVKRLSTTPD